MKTFPQLIESVNFPHLLDFTEMLFRGQEKILIQELMLLDKIMSTKVSTSKDHFQQMQTNTLPIVCLQVQDIVLNLFIQKNLPAEIRMLACMVLLETKPSIALISVITEVLLEEIDLQVASFSYSLLKGIAKSRTPDNQHL